MKVYLTTLILTFTILTTSFSVNINSTDELIAQTTNPDSTISFVTTFNIDKATKDGYYLEEYVVDVDQKQAKKINGKKIRVTGKVTIVKGLINEPDKFDNNGNRIIKQGRAQDTKLISNPSIEVLD